MPDGPSERPEDIRFISGVILVSRQPERVARFYRDVLGLPLAEERHSETQLHWGCELGDVHFAIHPAQDYPDDPSDGPGPFKLAFMVFDLPHMVAWLDECGVPLCYPPTDLGSQSRITAVRDPDGNLVELTQLGPDWLSHLKAHRAEGHDLVSAWGARLAADRTLSVGVADGAGGEGDAS
jgi:catechol 2,3-dioxygenase-like lactoylglutathione lyase family enzyme